MNYGRVGIRCVVNGEDVDTAGHGKCNTKIGGIANMQRRSLRAQFALPIMPVGSERA